MRLLGACWDWQQIPTHTDRESDVVALSKADGAHLEDVERLELNVLALVSERVHDNLEVIRAGYVTGHDPVVCPI